MWLPKNSSPAELVWRSPVSGDVQRIPMLCATPDGKQAPAQLLLEQTADLYKLVPPGLRLHVFAETHDDHAWGVSLHRVCDGELLALQYARRALPSEIDVPGGADWATWLYVRAIERGCGQEPSDWGTFYYHQLAFKDAAGQELILSEGRRGQIGGFQIDVHQAHIDDWDDGGCLDWGGGGDIYDFSLFRE